MFQFRFNMHRLMLSVLCVGAALLSVNCDSTDEFIDQILEKTDNMLTKYDRDLDKAVPFKEFRASLKALDLMAHDYQGESREPIYQATNAGYQATDKYYEATDAIFSWCVKADTVITYIIEEDPEKKLAFKSLYKLTGKGVVAIKESLAKLEEVRNELTAMSNKLRPVPSALTKELGELRQKHLEHMAKLKKLKWGLLAALALIGVVATIILGFVSGPVGIAIGVTGTMAAAGIPFGVIHGLVEPNEEQKWKITEAYYKSLIEAVNHAQGNVTSVKDSLDTEITQVQRLRGSVEGQLDIMEDFPGLTKNSKNQLSKLSKTLQEFITRHGGGSNHRRKREVLKAYRGLDVERVSFAVDAYLNATANEREAAFWTLPAFPMHGNHFIGDLSKFSYL